MACCFFGNKTFNQRFDANLKEPFFCNILLQITCFFLFFSFLPLKVFWVPSTQTLVEIYNNDAPEALGCATELANRVCLWSLLLVGSEPPNPSAALLVFLSSSCSECLVILAGAGAGAVWDPALNEKCLKGFLLLGVGCGVLITSPMLCCKGKKMFKFKKAGAVSSSFILQLGSEYQTIPFSNFQNPFWLWRVWFLEIICWI